MFYFLWCRFPKIIQGYIKSSPHCPGWTSLKNIHNALLVLVTGRNSTLSSQELKAPTPYQPASERLGCRVGSSGSSMCISTSLRKLSKSFLGKKRVWTTVQNNSKQTSFCPTTQLLKAVKLSKVKRVPSFSDKTRSRTTAASPPYPGRARAAPLTKGRFLVSALPECRSWLNIPLPITQKFGSAMEERTGGKRQLGLQSSQVCAR